MLDPLTGVLSALAHPLRRRILEEAGAGEIAAGKLAGRLGCSPSVLSQHLKVLEGAGLVRRRAQWRTHLVSAEAEPLADVVDWAERQTAAWTLRLRALKAVMEEGFDG